MMDSERPQAKSHRRRISLDRVNSPPQNEDSRGRVAQRRGSPNTSMQHARPLQRNIHASVKEERTQHSRSRPFQHEERARQPLSQLPDNNRTQLPTGQHFHDNDRLSNSKSGPSRNNGRLPQPTMQASNDQRGYTSTPQPHYQAEEQEIVNETRVGPYYQAEEQYNVEETRGDPYYQAEKQEIVNETRGGRYHQVGVENTLASRPYIEAEGTIENARTPQHKTPNPDGTRHPYRGHKRSEGFLYSIKRVGLDAGQELETGESIEHEPYQDAGYQTNHQHSGQSDRSSENEQAQEFRLGDLEEQALRPGPGDNYPQHPLRPQRSEMNIRQRQGYSVRTSFGPGPDLKPNAGSGSLTQGHEDIRGDIVPVSSVVPGLYQSSRTRGRVLGDVEVNMNAEYYSKTDSIDRDRVWPSKIEESRIHPQENDRLPRGSKPFSAAVPKGYRTILQTRDSDMNEDLYEMGERLIGNDVGIDSQPKDREEYGKLWCEWAAMTGGQSEFVREGSPPREESLPQEQSLPHENTLLRAGHLLQEGYQLQEGPYFQKVSQPREVSRLQEVPQPQERYHPHEGSQPQAPPPQGFNGAQVSKDYEQRFFRKQGEPIDRPRSRTPERYQGVRQVSNPRHDYQSTQLSPPCNDDSSNFSGDSVISQNNNDAIFRRDEASTIPGVAVGFDSDPRGNFAKASVIKNMASNARLNVKKSIQNLRHVPAGSTGEQTPGTSNKPAKTSTTRAFIGGLGRVIPPRILPRMGEVGVAVPSRAKAKLLDLTEASNSTANYSNPVGLIAEERVAMYKNAQRKAVLRGRVGAKANAESQAKEMVSSSNESRTKSESLETHSTWNGSATGQEVHHDQQMASTSIPRTDANAYRMATGQALSPRHPWWDDRAYVDESQPTRNGALTQNEVQYAPDSYERNPNINAYSRNGPTGRAVSNDQVPVHNHGSADTNQRVPYSKFNQGGRSAEEGFTTSTNGSSQAEHRSYGIYGTYDAFKGVPDTRTWKYPDGTKVNEFQMHDSMSPVCTQTSGRTFRSENIGRTPVMQKYRTQQEEDDAEMLLGQHAVRQPAIGEYQPFGKKEDAYSAPTYSAKDTQPGKLHLSAGRQNMPLSKPSMVSDTEKNDIRSFQRYNGGRDEPYDENFSFEGQADVGSYASLLDLSAGRLDMLALSPPEPPPKPWIERREHKLHPNPAKSSATTGGDSDGISHHTRMSPRGPKLYTAENRYTDASMHNEYRHEQGNRLVVGSRSDFATQQNTERRVKSPYNAGHVKLRQTITQGPELQDDRKDAHGPKILVFIANSAKHTEAAWSCMKEARNDIQRPLLAKKAFRKKILMAVYELQGGIQNLEEALKFEESFPGNAFGTYSTEIIYEAFKKLADVVQGLASELTSVANDSKSINALSAETAIKLVHQLRAHVGIFDSFINRNCGYFDPRFITHPNRARIGGIFNSINKMETARRNWEKVGRDTKR